MRSLWTSRGYESKNPKKSLDSPRCSMYKLVSMETNLMEINALEGNPAQCFPAHSLQP
jgi:hypothetical protein